MRLVSAASCALVIAGCDAEPTPPVQPAPLSAEDQLRAAVRGQPDDEVRAIASAIESKLSDAERTSLAQRDFAQSPGAELLQDGAYMHGWGVVASELVGVAPRHLIEHPPCADVEGVLGGWAAGAGSILREELGGTLAGEHAPAVILFVSKKTAQSWRATIDLAFEHGNHCAAAYDGGVCGSPGAACCAGTCFEGTTCVGGLCL